MLLIVAVYLVAGYAIQAFAVPGLMQGLWHLPTFQAFLAGGLCSAPVLVLARRRLRARRGRAPGAGAPRMARPRGLARERPSC